MRIVKILLLVLTAAAVIAYSAVEIQAAFFTDKTPPVITFDTDTLQLSVHDDASALLDGVCASDDRDGDLTGQVLIRSVSQFTGENTALVSYIVFDSSDNMGTASRSVVYTDYTPPRFALNEPLVFAPSSSVALSSRLTAQDVLDGDISDSIRLVSSNLASGTEGEYVVAVQVTNSMGDTAEAALPVIIRRASAQAPVLALKEALVYLPEGSDFSARDYFLGLWESQAAADSGQTMQSSLSGVEVESNVNTDVPGCYKVLYRYRNGAGYEGCAGLAGVIE